MAGTKDKKMCFVITPIGDSNSDIRRHIDGIIDQVIVPALGERYEIEVAHRKYEIGSINDRVVKSVYEADLVIANLTTINPNVMYELAIRYSFGKPAIVIAEEGTKLPFDVIDENTIFYVNDPAGANELKQKLIEFEKTINVKNQEYGPVYKVIRNIPLYNEVESGQNVPNDKALQYIIDRLDSLEKSINSKGEVSKSLEKYKILVKFKKDELITDDEVEEIFSIFAINNYEVLTSERYDNDFNVVCTVNSRELSEMKILLNQLLSNKNISYEVLYLI